VVPDDHELRRIAAHVRRPAASLTTVNRNGFRVLRRGPAGCIFLEPTEQGASCAIYAVRPDICRRYPFTNSDEIDDCR